MSYKEILTKGAEVNKIGNYVSLSVGAGSTVLKATGNFLWAGASTPSSAPFKVNRQTGALTATNATITGAITATSGSFTGAVTATSGSFTGTITATGGSITGNMNVTAALIFKSGSTEKGRIYCDSSKMYIQVGGSGKGCYFDSDGNFFAPDASMYVYNDIQSGHGSIYAYNDVYSTNGSVRAYNDVYSTHGSVYAQNDVYSQGGSVRAYNDIYSTNGKLKAPDWIWCTSSDKGFKVGDKEGTSFSSGDEIVTSVFEEDNKLKIRTRIYKCNGGIITSRGGENERTVFDFDDL